MVALFGTNVNNTNDKSETSAEVNHNSNNYKSNEFTKSKSINNISTFSLISFDGDGTSENPYILENSSQFVELQTKVNDGTLITRDKYFKISDNLKDITLDNWIPIGNLDYPFQGNFDGNNCKITFSIDMVLSSSNTYFGFFGRLNSNDRNDQEGIITQKISNLYFYHSKIRITSRSLQSKIYVGLIAGYCSNYYAFREGGVLFSNCVIEGIPNDSSIILDELSITGNIEIMVGGVLGFFSSRFSNYATIIDNMTINNLNITINRIRIESMRFSLLLGLFSGGFNLNVAEIKNIYISNSNVNISPDTTFNTIDLFYGGLFGSCLFNGIVNLHNCIVNNVNFNLTGDNLTQLYKSNFCLGLIIGKQRFGLTVAKIYDNYVINSTIKSTYHLNASLNGELYLSYLIGYSTCYGDPSSDSPSFYNNYVYGNSLNFDIANFKHNIGILIGYLRMEETEVILNFVANSIILKKMSTDNEINPTKPIGFCNLRHSIYKVIFKWCSNYISLFSGLSEDFFIPASDYVSNIVLRLNENNKVLDTSLSPLDRDSLNESIDNLMVGSVNKYRKFANPTTGDFGFILKFNTDGGTTIEDRYNIYNPKGYSNYNLDDLSTTKEGYEIESWYLDNDFLVEANLENVKTMTQDLTLYAKWKEKVVPPLPPSKPNIPIGEVFNIFYDTKMGIINDLNYPTTYVCGSNVILPINVTKANYDFVGWNYSNLFGVIIKNIPSSKYGDVYLDANYVTSPYANKYPITYVVDHGKINGEYSKNYLDEEIILPTDVKSDYGEFIGWYLNSDFNGKRIYKINKGETGNKTFYARYRLYPYLIRYVIDDENVIEDYYYYGNEVTLLSDFNKSGYVFVGLSETKGDDKNIITKISRGESGNKVYYVIFKKNVRIRILYLFSIILFILFSLLIILGIRHYIKQKNLKKE